MTAKQSLSGQRESQAKAFPEKAEKGKAFAGAHEIPENQESQSRKVRAYLKKAASDKVFPGCVLACGSPGEGKVSCFWAGQRGLSRNREPVSSDLVYDLASITKVLSTTFLLAIAVNEGLVSLGSRLDGLGWPVPGSHKRLAIVDLLAHSSGLPAWRPYYLDKRLAERDRLIETILNEPKVSSVGGLTLYSDLNFILLGFVLEQVWDKDLKTLFSEKIAAPLGLVATGFRPDPL
ncbi:MAG: beta-lactamase family protein, partial [Deltaproteobacteria bacterium]|nr:beta-lactamase family protein [Deltaproteobacteria bacterium]